MVREQPVKVCLPDHGCLPGHASSHGEAALCQLHGEIQLQPALVRPLELSSAFPGLNVPPIRHRLLPVRHARLRGGLLSISANRSAFF